MENNKNLDKFIVKAINKYGDLYDYSKVKYKDNKTSITIICKKHGEFNISPDNFLNKSKCGCPKCGIELRGFNKKLTNLEFVQRSILIHGEKYDYSSSIYKGIHTKINIVCKIHGNFSQDPASHLSGHGCPKCAYEESSKKQQMSKKEFLDKCILVHEDRYDYSKVIYDGIYKPIIIICKEHGEFLQLPIVHLQGCGCTKCRLKNQNKLFDSIKSKYINEDIFWEYSPEWLGKQRFDISFPKYKIAIEYNGRQHYIPIKLFGGEIGFKKTVSRDILKYEKSKLYDWDIFYIKYNYSDDDYKLLLKNIDDKIKKYSIISYA